MAGRRALPLESRAADKMQDLVNQALWFGEVTNQELEVVLGVQAMHSPAKIMPDELERWHVAYMRRGVRFGSGRYLEPGDVVLVRVQDDDDLPMAAAWVWSPRVMHIGVVEEDFVDPL